MVNLKNNKMQEVKGRRSRCDKRQMEMKMEERETPGRGCTPCRKLAGQKWVETKRKQIFPAVSLVVVSPPSPPQAC
jgi:hypothetical protein